jgi:hypothetical protein
MKTKHHINLSAPVIQSGEQTLNNPIRRKWFALALGGFLFTSIFALSAPPVEAGCQQWDVSGSWMVRQSNGSAMQVELTQSGTTLSGEAKNYPGGYDWVNVSGSILGNDFYLRVRWNVAGTSIGVYRGKVGAGGRLNGTTYDEAKPSEKATWVSERAMKCADAAPAPAAAAKPAPIKSSASVLKDGSFAKPKPATTPVSGSGTAGGFIQMHTPAPSPEAAESASAEADESSSNDTDDQHGKHKKNKKKHHHHHDDDQNQGND